MIDLDDENHQPAESNTAASGRLTMRRKMALRLVAAFVVGVVLGGLGVSELRDSREQRERNSVVALVAVPQSASGGLFSQGWVQLNGQLMLINTGPAPITVRGVTAERRGVMIHSIEDSRLLRPGGTGQVMVELRLDCSRSFQPEPLSLRLSVQTGDEHVREVSYPVVLQGNDWQREALGECGSRS